MILPNPPDFDLVRSFDFKSLAKFHMDLWKGGAQNDKFLILATKKQNATRQSGKNLTRRTQK